MQAAALETRITLPWPEGVLSPNWRVHWARKAKATKDARLSAGWLVRAEIDRQPNWRGANISMTFCPPDKRRRDLDNLIASSKASCDGIADALGVDDSRFSYSYRMGPVVAGGAVHVVISPAEAI